jgi:hypothetical protein
VQVFKKHFMIKNSKFKETKLQKSKKIIRKKAAYSKIQIQKAQQFIDNYTKKKIDC